MLHSLGESASQITDSVNYSSNIMKQKESYKQGLILARNWVPKIGKCKLFGHPIFQGRPQYTLVTTINMYLLIRHIILIQCHGIYVGVNTLITCLKMTF